VKGYRGWGLRGLGALEGENDFRDRTIGGECFIFQWGTMVRREVKCLSDREKLKSLLKLSDCKRILQ